MQEAKSVRAVTAIILSAGVGATVTQLVTTREFLAQFSGNEFVIALNLFGWLAAGGLGAWASRPAWRKRYPERDALGLSILALVMAVLPLVQMMAIRLLRDRVFLPGSSVGFHATLGFILLTGSPYSFAAGYLVPRALGVLRRLDPAATAVRAYVLDNAGNVIGGLLFAFVLVWWTSPLSALVLSGLPLLGSAVELLRLRGHRWPGLLVAAGTVMGIFIGGLAWEADSLAHGRGRLLHYEETRFGRLTVHRDQDQVTLFRDGRPSASSHDPAAAEAAVHYPLALCNRPRRVLLIGAQAGMLGELDKYRLEEVDYLEIDPAAARVHFAFGLLRPIAALRTIAEDGRAFLAAGGEPYDAIVINMPEPDTFQVNRFFTEEFFRLAAGRLGPGGVLGFSVQGYANYLSEAQRMKLSVIRATAGRHFAHVRLLPGERVHFLCRQTPMALDIPERLAAQGIVTLYVGPYFHDEIDPWRIAQLSDQLAPDAPLNRDMRPHLVRILFDAWFEKFSTSPLAFTLVVLLLGAGWAVRMSAVQYVLMSTGAMLMGGMILSVFAFQVVFGYIYHQLGLIVTVFLAGLLPGAWWAGRSRIDPRGLLLMGDLVLIGLMGGFVGLLAWDPERLSFAVFAVFGLLLSWACGVQFPAAVRVGGEGLGAAASAFGADLLGAALGALLVSVVLIPCLGFFHAAGLLTAIKLSSLAITGGRRWKT
jgi:spermidine synthase